MHGMINKELASWNNKLTKKQIIPISTLEQQNNMLMEDATNATRTGLK